MRRLLLRKAARATLSRVLSVSLALGLVAFLAAPASAHGDLVDGSPGPGDVVAVGTTLLRLEFSALDESAAPLVAVRGATGAPVAVGAADYSEKGTICALSTPLEAGVTTIDYSVLADDGDRQTGSYTFEVSAEGAAVEPATCDAGSLAAPDKAQTLEEMGSVSIPSVVLYGLAGLAVLAAGLLVVRIRADRRDHPVDDSLTED